MRRVRDGQNRLGMTVSRATIEKVDDKKKMQSINVKAAGDADGDDEQQTELEHAHPYGFTSVPKKPTGKQKAEAIVVYPNGDRSHGIAIVVGDRRFRLKDLGEGDVALHDDQGQKIHLGRNKTISIISGGTITITGTKIILNGEVHLGGEGGQLVHRKNDVDSGGDTATGSATKVYAV